MRVKVITQQRMFKEYDFQSVELRKLCDKLKIKPRKRDVEGRVQLCYLAPEFERIMEARGYSLQQINGIEKWVRVRAYRTPQYSEA